MPKSMLYPSESLPDLQSLEAFIARLAAKPDPIYHDIFCLALHASLSVDHVLKLRAQHIDANGSITVSRGRQNTKEEHVLLDQRSLDIINRRAKTAVGGVLFPSPVRPDQPISKATIGNAWTATRRQLQIKSKDKADPLTEEQAQQFRQHLKQHYPLMYCDIWDMQMSTQQRISDVLLMNTHSIQAQDKRWDFKTRKNAKIQRIEIIGGARDVLTRRLRLARAAQHPWLFPSPVKPEKAITARSVGRIFKQTGDELKLSANCGCHTPRKTGAMLAFKNGVPIETLMKLLGHSNIETTMLYLGISNADVAAVRAKIAEMIG